MRALLVIESDRIADLARFYLRPLGFECLRYRNPVKAIDNLEEIDPDAIIISARDFPRHWKVLAQTVRSEKDKSECVIVLLKGDYFPLDEAAKATALGINGVAREELDDQKEQLRFQELVKRYIAIEDERIADRIAPSSWDRLELIFSHPRTLTPITGKLETVSAQGFSFIPDNPALTDNLAAGEVLEDCSMRVGDDIIELSCSIIHADRVLGLGIHQIADSDREKLGSYLEAFPNREMNAILERGQSEED